MSIGSRIVKQLIVCVCVCVWVLIACICYMTATSHPSNSLLHKTIKYLSSCRLKFVVPVLPNSNDDFFLTSCQAFIRCVGKVIKRHAHRLIVLEFWLVLLVVKLSCLLHCQLSSPRMGRREGHTFYGRRKELDDLDRRSPQLLTQAQDVMMQGRFAGAVVCTPYNWNQC